MKFKTIAITLLFVMLFSTTVFATTFPTTDNIKPNKIWTINFNKDIETIRMNIVDKDNNFVPCMVYIKNEKVTVVPFSDYLEGEYTLTIESVLAKDESILTETVNMKFIVKEQ